MGIIHSWPGLLVRSSSVKRTNAFRFNREATVYWCLAILRNRRMIVAISPTAIPVGNPSRALIVF